MIGVLPPIGGANREFFWPDIRPFCFVALLVPSASTPFLPSQPAVTDTNSSSSGPTNAFGSARTNAQRKNYNVPIPPYPSVALCRQFLAPCLALKRRTRQTGRVRKINRVPW